jgi:hypothetical protein
VIERERLAATKNAKRKRIASIAHESCCRSGELMSVSDDTETRILRRRHVKVAYALEPHAQINQVPMGTLPLQSWRGEHLLQ